MRAMLLAALLLLAGCADAPVEEEPEKFQQVKASSTTGLIRGVVVDSGINPVAGVTITTSPGALQTTSDEEGLFVFQELEPGTYFLKAEAAHIDPIQTSVVVEAGVDNPPVVRMQVQVVPPPVPNFQAFTYTFITTGSAWVDGVGGIVFTDLVGDGHFFTSFDMEGNTTWVQSELVWEALQPLAESFFLPSSLSVTDGEGIASAGPAGPSPLLTTYPSEEITSTAPLSLGQTIYVHNGENPVGVTFDQQLDLFVHAFQHATPEDGWRFSEAGAPRV